MIDLNKEKLELNYPCNWEYKLVVLEHINIKATVKEVIFEREHKVKNSKVILWNYWFIMKMIEKNYLRY